MARNFYRIYLYTVLIVLLSFAIYALARILEPLLRLTPLRAAYQVPPGRTELVQNLVFAVTVLLVVALLGGLHYWLLRRDLRQEPAAGQGAVRAVFLNLSELLIAPVAVTAIGQLFISGEAGVVAMGISLLVGLLVLEWERRRLPAGSGLALLFQRLHVYGVQLALLFPLFTGFIYALMLFQDAWFNGGSVLHFTPCFSFISCGERLNLISYLAQALWFLLAWSAYAYLSRRDAGSLLRRLLYAGSLAYGLLLAIEELAGLLDILLRLLFHIQVTREDLLFPPGALIAGERLAALPVGLLVAVLSWLWLRCEIPLLPDPQRARAMLSTSLIAIAAALLALALWVGVGRLLLALLLSLFPTGGRPLPGDWIAGVALLLIGLGELPLDLLLRRRSLREPAVALLPRRGFVLTALAAGVLAAAIGGAIALYAWGTAVLGAPVGDWPRLAQQALTSCLVGVAIVALYLWRARRERLLVFAVPALAEGVRGPRLSVPGEEGRAEAEEALVSRSRTSETLEGILESLLAQRITLEEAAARIRALARQSPAL